MKTSQLVITWVGGLLACLILFGSVVAIQYTAQQDRRADDKFIACVKAGNPPADCKLATASRY